MIVLISYAWVGIMMLFDFSMWEHNILSFYWEWLDSSKYRIVKAFGLCIPCTGLWWGILFYYLIFHKIDGQLIIFSGISEMILIFYHILKLFLRK